MPIVLRHGQAIAEPRSRLLRFERPTAGTAAAAAVGHPPLGLDPRRDLARLALDLVVRTAEPIDVPSRWATFTFGAEVDRTRAQLQPIRSRDALLASFSREASIALSRAAVESGLPPGPVRVAYAICWLELGDGRTRPAWSSFVAGPVDIVAGAISGALGQADDQRKGEITT
jgi:hypothetical protein